MENIYEEKMKRKMKKKIKRLEKVHEGLDNTCDNVGYYASEVFESFGLSMLLMPICAMGVFGLAELIKFLFSVGGVGNIILGVLSGIMCGVCALLTIIPASAIIAKVIEYATYGLDCGVSKKLEKTKADYKELDIILSDEKDLTEEKSSEKKSRRTRLLERKVKRMKNKEIKKTTRLIKKMLKRKPVVAEKSENEPNKKSIIDVEVDKNEFITGSTLQTDDNELMK